MTSIFTFHKKIHSEYVLDGHVILYIHTRVLLIYSGSCQACYRYLLNGFVKHFTFSCSLDLLKMTSVTTFHTEIHSVHVLDGQIIHCIYIRVLVLYSG